MSLVVLDKETFAKGKIDSYPLLSVYKDNAYTLELPPEDFRMVYKVVAIELFEDKVYFYAPKLKVFHFYVSKADLPNLRFDFPEDNELTFHRIAFSRQDVEEFFKEIGLSLEPSKLENMAGELFLVFASDHRRNVCVALRYISDPTREQSMKYVETEWINLSQQEETIENSPTL